LQPVRREHRQGTTVTPSQDRYRYHRDTVTRSLQVPLPGGQPAGFCSFTGLYPAAVQRFGGGGLHHIHAISDTDMTQSTDSTSRSQEQKQGIINPLLAIMSRPVMLDFDRDYTPALWEESR